MAHPLRDRMKQQGATPETPKPKPLAERKVHGWTMRVMGRNVGTLTDPEGRTMTMHIDNGVAIAINDLPVFNHEAGKTLSTMLRDRQYS